jgi:hypothetical protein
MNWKARLIAILPFVIAAILMSFALNAHRWDIARSHNLERYLFLFALPWAWIVDSISAPRFQNHLADVLVFYALLLWLPAFLYSLCIWTLIRLVGRRKKLGGA